MKNNKKWFSKAVGALVGLACALMLGALFYGAMAYQLSGEPAQRNQEPGSESGLLALPGAQLLSEQTTNEEMGGEICRVTTRVYRLDDGVEVQAVSATPAAYIERLSAEKWTAQLVTGFSLAGMDAVYSVRGGEGMLSCRAGERIYMLCAAAQEQTLYTLGTQAVIE